MRYITLLFYSFLVCTQIEAQNFQILNRKTLEPIEQVNAIMYVRDVPKYIARSDYKGEIEFASTKDWDSVIFLRLGYKKQVVERINYLKIILLTPLQNQIEEVIITGQIVPSNKYQSPFKLKFFTAEEIKNKNAISLADFLQTENNFSVTQDPLLGSKVAINGMSGADLKLLVDGIPVAGRMNGNIDYSQILLANIERIEVVDGPLSTIYGTNATGGVINLITKTGGAQSESNFTGNLYTESIGAINTNLYYNTTKNGHRVSLGVHRNVFHGWDPRADSLRAAVKPLWREQAWKPKEQTMFNSSYYAPISKKVNIHFKLNGFWESLINKLDPNSAQQIQVLDEIYNTTRINVGGTSNAIFNKTLELQNYANFNYFGRNTDFYSQNLKDGTRVQINQRREEILNYFARSQFKHEIRNTEIKLLYGADFNMDVGTSDRLDSQVQAVRDLSLFAMGNFRVGSKWLIQPGLRHSFNNISSVPLSATVNCRYNTNSHMSMRFSYSRGYRIPEIKELYFRFVDINHNIQGNPQLRAEVNDNFQFGIDIKPPKDRERSSLLSYSTSFNTSFFLKQDAIDIVSIDPSQNEFRYFNLGNYNGLIFNLDNRVKYKEYIFSFGLAVNGFSRRFDLVANQIDQYLFNWTTNANFTYHVKKWDIKLSSINKFNSANRFVVYNLPLNRIEESEIPAFMYSDINASKNLFSNKINLTIGIKNLFDIRNLTVLGYNGNFHNAGATNEINNLWGRTAFASINLNLEVFK